MHLNRHSYFCLYTVSHVMEDHLCNLKLCILLFQMSTSSSSSSLPSLDVSVHSGGTTASGRTPDRSVSTTQLNQPNQPKETSPYITPDFYIIRVSIESSAHEVEGESH